MRNIALLSVIIALLFAFGWPLFRLAVDIARSGSFQNRDVAVLGQAEHVFAGEGADITKVISLFSAVLIGLGAVFFSGKRGDRSERFGWLIVAALSVTLIVAVVTYYEVAAHTESLAQYHNVPDIDRIALAKSWLSGRIDQLLVLFGVTLGVQLQAVR